MSLIGDTLYHHHVHLPRFRRKRKKMIVVAASWGVRCRWLDNGVNLAKDLTLQSDGNTSEYAVMMYPIQI